jgi:hypothetical protein
MQIMPPIATPVPGNDSNALIHIGNRFRPGLARDLLTTSKPPNDKRPPVRATIGPGEDIR